MGVQIGGGAGVRGVYSVASSALPDGLATAAPYAYEGYGAAGDVDRRHDLSQEEPGHGGRQEWQRQVHEGWDVGRYPAEAPGEQDGAHAARHDHDTEHLQHVRAGHVQDVSGG